MTDANRNNTLEPDTILLGEALYAEALNIVIAQATTDLLIFDQDLTHGDYKGLARYHAIQHYLSQQTQNKLTMILHQSDFLTSQCPRLMELLLTYGHKMTVYITNDSAKVAKDCFVIADGVHYVKRMHINHARFKYALNDAESCAGLRMRFNELLEETSHTVSATQLGL